MNVDLTIFYDFLKTAGVIFIDKGFTNRATFIERRLLFYIFHSDFATSQQIWAQF